VEKRTTIYLDEADQRAIEVIQADHVRRGVKLTASAAIRLALREAADRLERRTRGRSSRSDGGTSSGSESGDD
jgi:hypothetical protein